MIIMLRHGETAWNTGDSQERIRGWMDVPLSRDGMHAAEEAAVALAPLPIQHLYSSDMRRAADTATLWSHRAQNVLMTLHSDLRPWNFGAMNGSLVDIAKPMIDWLVAHPDEPAPGGGESLNSYLTRYLSFIMPLVRSPRLHGVVAHFRNFKALEAHINAKGKGIHLPTWNGAPSVEPGHAMYFRSDRYAPFKGLDKLKAPSQTQR